MWTHKHPYRPSEFTRESIERRGRIALSRALNIGRVIGFVGSGATKAYGRPAWKGLVDKAISVVEQHQQSEPTERQSAGRLLDQLHGIAAGEEGDLPQRLILALGAAEELAEKLGVLREVRAKIAEMVGHPRATSRAAASRKLSEIKFPDGATLAAIDKPGLLCKAEPLQALIRDLRINRMLTLNYDLEIEREFRRWYRSSGAESRGKLSGGDPRSEFEILCDFRIPMEEDRPEGGAQQDGEGRGADDRELLRELGQSVVHTDGIRRSLRSVSMNDSNIGDLVNFALHPRSYEAQVFHLHGRCDKPQDMVMTERDYQRTYLKPGAQQHTFDEALSTIFAGNEVLFVGVGMDEADMMRPLRQFVSQERRSDMAKQPVYALMEHSVGFALDGNFAEDTRLHRHESGYVRDTTDDDKEKVPQADRDRISENARALELYSQFGVHAIYYGGQVLRDLRLLCQLVKERLKLTDWETREGDQGKTLTDKAAAWTVAWEFMVGEFESERGSREEYETVLGDEDFARLKDWIKAFGAHFSEARELSKENATALTEFADALEGEIRARALEAELKRLAEDRDEWWEDWRRVPRQRQARYPTRTQPDAMPTASGAAEEGDPVYSEGLPTGDRTDAQRPRVLTQITSRHRPRYREHDPDKPVAFEALEVLRQMGREVEDARDAILEASGSASSGNGAAGTALPEPDVPGDYPHGDPEGLRVIRCTLPRGGGKGALLHALQEFTGPDRAPELSTIFKQNSGFAYGSAFCINLSFSMEFASVIEALRRFFKKALIELMEDRRTTLQQLLLEKIRDRNLVSDNEFLNTHFFQELFAFGQGLDGDLDPSLASGSYVVPGMQDGALNSDPSGKPILPLRQYWPLDPDMVDRFANLANPRERQPNRQQQQHRVDKLRHYMEMYRDLAGWDGRFGPDKSLSEGLSVLHREAIDSRRLFVCLSGLDKLCDQGGVAFNPMFRALFRLLTGCGRKRPDEAPARMPLDLLLISGTPDVPTRYLSHEVKLDELKSKNGRKVAMNDLFAVPGASVALQKWPLIPPVSLAERYWLTLGVTDTVGDDLGEARRRVRNEMRDRLVPVTDTSDFQIDPPRYPYLRGLLGDSVALSTWVFGVALLSEDERRSAEDTGALVDKILSRLEAAAARAGSNGVLRSLIADMEDNLGHSPTLNARCLEREERRAEIYLSSLEAFAGESRNVELEPSKKFLDKLKKTQGSGDFDEGWYSRQIQLVKLVLQHLAAFPIPVEPRVLYGCPELKDALLHKLRLNWRLAAKRARPVAGPDEKPESEALRQSQHRFDEGLRKAARKMHWASRELAMEELEDVLLALKELQLIIEIRPKKDHKPKQSQDTSSAAAGGEAQEEVPLRHHWRYTVHPQLRDFLAHQMRFFVPDRGERNFFQVSLYCDQPRDLPTPTEEHYRMFREILNGQISACQRTLWHFYQWDCAHAHELAKKQGKLENSRQRPLPASDLARFQRGFPRRLTTSEGNFDQDLLSVHAVPQRIRALYGLVRAGFSIGAISRLSRFQDGAETDQPYESFRGWLRALTNAAIGMDEQWIKFLDVAGYGLDRYGREIEGVSDPGRPGSRNEPVMTRGEGRAIEIWLNRADRDAGKEPDLAHPSPVHMPARPFYRDEIGWLLNERGLISFVQGYLFDAIPLYQRALLVMRHAANGSRDDPALHAATRRVRLNLALAHIDRGNLFRARQMIEALRLPEGILPHSGSTISRIGQGYIGVIEHLSGHFQSAEKRYEELIGWANEKQMLRLVSIFNRHYADLLRSMGRTEDATSRISLAIHAAMQSEQRDILHAARLSMTRIRTAGGEAPMDTDMVNVERCQAFATQMGVPRLQTEALRVQAEVMLNRGERVMAGQIAAHAAGIAARCGLRLHKVSALNIYANALAKRQQHDLCRDVLSEARSEAERLGFQTRAGEMSDQIAASNQN